MTAEKIPQIAVSGYYGCGNAGDEAVLAGLRTSFERIAPGRVKLVALSQNPVETTHLHAIPSAYRMSIGSLQATLEKTDLLLSGGGSLLQDTTSVRSLLYYLFVCRLARHHRIPYMFFAQGLGPLSRPLSRTVVRKVANRAAGITVRDVGSAELLAEIGVTLPAIEVTADPAFALNPAPSSQIDALFAKEGLPLESRFIGVALRSWGAEPEKTAAHYAQLLDSLSGHISERILLIPMQIPNDLDFARRVVQQTRHPEEFRFVQNPYSPEEVLGVVGRMQSVVAMRLHTLIFAARACVPSFALSYDPKVASLMHRLGLEQDCVDWSDFEGEATAQRIAESLSNSSSRVLHLQNQKPQLEALALRNAERALEILAQR